MIKKVLIFAGVSFIAACEMFKPEPQIQAPLPLHRTVNMDFSNVDLDPNIYAIAARRATNMMIDDTTSLYSKKEPKPKLYVDAIKKLNEKMPDGFYYARKATIQIIEGSKTFNVVDKLDEADYSLASWVNALPNPNSETPIIDYQLVLNNKNGDEVDSWNVTIRQAENDNQSWW